MKHITKILALALALIMVLGLATTVSADEATTYSVTIKNTTGHTYKIYQIFVGDLTVEDGKEILSNIKYGANYGTSGQPVPKSVLENLDLDAITPTGEGTVMTSSGDTATISGLAAGYYMIVDVTEELPDGDSSSAVIFQVVGDTVVTSKHDGTPVTYKKVDDINDSTGKGIDIEWHDSADHDVGDLIDFQLTAVIPGSIEAFREAKQAYPFTFHDVEEIGLAFQEIKKVYVVNGTEKTDITAYALNKETTDGCSFEVYFEDLTKIAAVKGGSSLVVEYQSVLTEAAVIGAAGNPNKMRGEFRKLYKPETPEFTPWDTVIVFTYKVEANKYADEVKDGNKLTGAGFTLYKWYGTDESGEWRAIGEEVKGEAMSTFAWERIDDGKYKLEETTTPAGYNTIAPIEFEVIAGHVIAADLPTLETLKGGDIFKGEVQSGVLAADIVNEKGVELPSTGGIGTTIFYIVGGLLAVAAVVLLVTKKRMASAE